MKDLGLIPLTSLTSDRWMELEFPVFRLMPVSFVIMTSSYAEDVDSYAEDIDDDF